MDYLDSSIRAMLKRQTGKNNPYLQQVALSNAADLYIHAGESEKGRTLQKCLKINSADFHSLTGLGWIALVSDKNDSLAEKYFPLLDAKINCLIRCLNSHRWLRSAEIVYWKKNVPGHLSQKLRKRIMEICIINT